MDKNVVLILKILSVLFGILGMIPIVNIFSTVIYSLIWFFLIAFKAPAYFKNPISPLVSGLCFILGLIPIVSLIPWATIGTFLGFSIAKRMNPDKKGGEMKSKAPATGAKPVEKNGNARNLDLSERGMAMRQGANYIDPYGRMRGEVGFKDPLAQE